MSNKRIMGRRDIFNRVYDYLISRGLKVTDLNEGKGYFIFDFGDDSVYHFRFKGAKMWKIGLWIIDDEKEYAVSLFAEHDDYINKFKPSQTRLSSRFKIGMDDLLTEDILNENLKDITDDFLKIAESPYRSKYRLYKHEDDNFLKFLWDDILWNRIIVPANKFKREKLSYFNVRLFAFLLRMRYRRLIAYGERNKDMFYPAATLKISYDNYNDEDKIYDIYHGRFLKMLNRFSKDSYWRIEHYENSNSKRTFYYDD